VNKITTVGMYNTTPNNFHTITCKGSCKPQTICAKNTKCIKNHQFYHWSCSKRS